MFVELHILQNFAPSNLNRDDTGAPKDCEFGGYRRARISSQAFKRAVRDYFKKVLKVPDESLGVRSKRLHAVVAGYLVEMGHDLDEAQRVTLAAFGGLGIIFETTKGGEDEEVIKSQYLVYVGPGELRRFAEVCHTEWDALMTAYAKVWINSASKAPSKDKASGAFGKAIKDKLATAFDGGKSADVALFGRMLADLPGKNRDAACQVAHAISTNRVSMEFDFYTAIDDRRPEDTEGSDMMGTVEYNSACYYRYANVDCRQLFDNLGGDEELARRTLEAFLRASVSAIPTGKQNSMAAQNAPSFVFAVVRDSGLWNLANAFLKPVHPSGQQDLMEASVACLDGYWSKLIGMYGDTGITQRCVASLDGDSGLTNLKEHQVQSLEDLIQQTVEIVSFQPAT